MAESKNQITFDQAGLGSILRQHQLAVPPNQREYAWTDREVTQLFQDFAKAIADGQDYFLGTIVTIPRKDGDLEVVDGQQRLATAAILLAAIRDYLKDKNEDIIVESINNEFLTGIDRTKRDRVAKLKLNVDDNELFGRIVRGMPIGDLIDSTRPSHVRLVEAQDEAAKFILRVVSTVERKDHGDILNRWVSFIEQHALAVLLRVPDDADAYKMFETLNDRGLRTSQADLIKNFLFGRSKSRFNEVQSRWASMRGALESLGEEDITINFLRHSLIAISGYLREAEVYDRVQNIAKSEQSTATFAAELESLANVYSATFNPEHERWNDYPDAARRAVTVFNLFNIRPFRPLLVAIAHRLDPKQAARAYEFLIALGVRLMIASTTRSGGVEVPLANTAHSVFNGTVMTADAIAKSLDAIIPIDQEFVSAFETARVSNARLARYYLRSLEMTAKNEGEPWFIPQDDRQTINLEHVLPRKPDNNWPSFTDDDVRLLATRLGNLSLLRASDNSNLKSSAFDKKKAIYGASPYVLTSQISTVDDWTAASIEERQKRLAELAVKTWPIARVKVDRAAARGDANQTARSIVGRATGTSEEVFTLDGGDDE